MSSEIRGALTAFAIVVAALLTLASFDLGIPGQSLLQSLRFHVAAALALLAVVLLLSRAWRRALLILVVVALSVGQGALIIHRQQQARAPLEAASPQPLLRLVSFNMLFDNVANAQQVADFLLHSDADVIVIMEADPLFGFLGQLQAAYPGRIGCDVRSACDLLLLSRTPLDGKTYPIYGGYRRLIVASTTVSGHLVNLVAAHLSKPYFDGLAVDQASLVAQALSRLDGPLLLAGDFNAAAWSDNIDRLARSQDLVPGPVYPATWPVPLGPLGIPIDNLFTRGGLLIRSVRSFEDSMGSNHRGLVAELSLAPKS